MKNLTKVSKGWILFSAAIAAAVILSIAVFFLLSRGGSERTDAPGYIAAAVAIIALVSFGFTFFARTRRGIFASRLRDDYYAAYERLKDYLNASTLGFFERRTAAQDVLELLLEAQRDNRPVADVLGADMGTFVRRLQESYGFRSAILIHLLNGALLTIFMLGIVQTAICFSSAESDLNFYQTRIGTQILPYLIVLSFVLAPLSRYLMARSRVLPLLAAYIGLVGLYLGSIAILRRFGGDSSWVRSYLDGTISFITSWASLAAWSAAAALIAVTRWVLRRLSIRRLA
jgi:DNA-binding ferritin-like protein (Dps family)